MAVNLATKYSEKVQQSFAQAALLKPSANKIEFTGARSVKITTVGTVPLTDYNRGASDNRFGTTVEVPDSVQELVMTQDKSFSAAIDKGNTVQQAIKKTGAFTRAQQDEVVVPTRERYNFLQLALHGGVIKGNAAAVDATNAETRLLAARKSMKDNHVPLRGCTYYVNTTVYNAILHLAAFVPAEKIAAKALANGVVGRLWGADVVEVPEDEFPAGVQFYLIHNQAYTDPVQLETLNLHKDPPHYDGDLVEGRYIYDLFVVGSKAMGVYVDVVTSAKAVAPAPTVSTAGAISVASGYVAKYTTDGSDPRYSESAVSITATTTPSGVTSGTVVKAYQYKADGSVYQSELGKNTVA